MGKFIVGALAVLAALGIIIHLSGNNLGATALTVPSTPHTPGFGLSWCFIIGGVLTFGVWRILKGK